LHNHVGLHQTFHRGSSRWRAIREMWKKERRILPAPISRAIFMKTCIILWLCKSFIHVSIEMRVSLAYCIIVPRVTEAAFAASSLSRQALPLHWNARRKSREIDNRKFHFNRLRMPRGAYQPSSRLSTLTVKSCSQSALACACQGGDSGAEPKFLAKVPLQPIIAIVLFRFWMSPLYSFRYDSGPS
jgi:hypothetical protein